MEPRTTPILRIFEILERTKKGKGRSTKIGRSWGVRFLGTLCGDIRKICQFLSGGVALGAEMTGVRSPEPKYKKNGRVPLLQFF